MTFELLPHDGRSARPYAEVTTTGSQVINTNAFTTVNLGTAVYDNGATTCGAALVDLANDVINLKRAGVWFVTANTSWSADTNANGYRRLEVGLNFFGGAQGVDLFSNTITFVQQSTGGIVNVGSNTGYGVYASVYHNSTSATLPATTTLRATWLAPFHA
jgi:hypothetical protein